MLEALRIQAVHFWNENELLRAQYNDIAQRLKDIAQERENERLRTQSKDNAQGLEQENERLRIQAWIEPDYTVAARQGEFQELGQPTTVAVAAAEPEPGVFCGRMINTTAAAKIFAVVHQDHYISTTADAPTGSTLNEPGALMTDPRPHAFGTKNVNLTVYSRAMVKVGPLARIRIDDEVYT